MSNSQILLAMDDVLEGQKISHWLNSYGYQTLIFTMWDLEGSINFENIKPDMILMDVVFKGNRKATKKLEKLKQDLDIPLLYLASDFDDYQNEIKILHNNKFLALPVDSRLLRSTLEITLYKHRMNQSLQYTEQRYRLLIENSDDPIAMISYSGDFLLVNQSAARFFGVEQGDFTGKSMWDMFPSEYANSQMKNIRAVIDNDEGRIIEAKTIIKGKELWFSNNLQPISINGQRAVQLIARDITSQKRMERTLKKSEEKFKAIFDNAYDSIFLYPFKNGIMENFVEVNNRACHQLGYTREQLLKMCPKDIALPEALEIMPKNLEKLKKDGKITFETMLVNSKGDEIPVEIISHFFKLYGEDMVLSIARDISERKKNENKLLRISTAIEGTSDAIGMSMPDGKHFYQNQAFSNLFGYSVDELNYPLGPVKLYEDPEVGRTVFETIMNGNSWDGELEMVDKNDRHFPVYLRANAIKNEHDEVIGLIGIHTNIKDRKKVEIALQESEEKFRTLAQSAVDAIIITDHLDRIVFCNRSMERIFDYADKEILGEYIDVLIPQRHTKEFQKKIYRHLEYEIGNVFEFYGLRKDGSEFPLEISLNTWEAADESYTTFIIRDITLRKLNEFKLKMREEIFQLMAENIDEVFWNIDPLTGQILYMSPSYHKIWGLSVENLYQNPLSWLESVHPNDKDKFVAYIFGKPGSDQNRKGIECRVIRPDGEVRWIIVRAFPVINQNKEIYRRVGLARDITAIKKIKTKNKESQVSGDLINYL
jgi:two-component system, sporulation sensor kinase E